MFQHTGTNSDEDVVGTLAFDDDVVDSRAMQQLTEQKAEQLGASLNSPVLTTLLTIGDADDQPWKPSAIWCPTAWAFPNRLTSRAFSSAARLILSQRYVQCSQAIWVAPFDAVRQDLSRGELVELELGIREPGGSVGLCSNPALPMPLAAQWCMEVLREVGQDYREGRYP